MSNSGMRTAVLKALDVAREESDKGRNVIILLPCYTGWIDPLKDAVRVAGLTSPMLRNPYPWVHIRASTKHHDMRSLLCDVLITVGLESSPGWDHIGLALVRERQRASIVKKEINIEVLG